MFLRIYSLILTALLFCNMWSLDHFYTYNETTGEKSHNYTVKLSRMDNRIKLEAATFYTVCDTMFNTIEYTGFTQDRIKYFHSSKNSDEIILKEYDKEKKLKVKSEFWYQTMFNMKDFLLSSENERSFFVLVDYSCDENNLKHKFRKFVLRKKGWESILHNGKKIDLCRLEMRLAGIGSKLWKADFWYRREDYMLYKFIMKKGGPGTEKTITTFVKESIME